MPVGGGAVRACQGFAAGERESAAVAAVDATAIASGACTRGPPEDTPECLPRDAFGFFSPLCRNPNSQGLHLVLVPLLAPAARPGSATGCTHGPPRGCLPCGRGRCPPGPAHWPRAAAPEQDDNAPPAQYGARSSAGVALGGVELVMVRLGSPVARRASRGARNRDCAMRHTRRAARSLLELRAWRGRWPETAGVSGAQLQHHHQQQQQQQQQRPRGEWSSWCTPLLTSGAS